ncbi:unnamed protein product [Scytosiphon promiscuus]
MLEPLESRCFTYVPTTWVQGNETLSKPFVFQWCHKGRATIGVNVARMRQQFDLGTSETTTVTLGPAVTGGRWREEHGEEEEEEEEEEGKHERHRKSQQGVEGEYSSAPRFLPAVAQHFTDGVPCSSLPGHSGGGRRRGEGKEGGRRAEAGTGEARSPASGSGERGRSSGQPDAVRLTVNLWCCEASSDEAPRDDDGGGGDARIVNLFEQEEPGAGGGSSSGNEGEGDGEGGGCGRLVASVCTRLLCPLYPEVEKPRRTISIGSSKGDGEKNTRGAKMGRGIRVEHGAYQTPRPKPFVSRRERGFLDYDRRQPMTREKRLELREEIREMFVHSYDGYMKHAFPGGELMPLSCGSGELHLVKVPLVTLVDTLDTLAIMGNATEFRRAVRLVADGLEVDADVDVSVFETNIRLLGGLLSAHLLASDPDLGLYSPDRDGDAAGRAACGPGAGAARLGTPVDSAVAAEKAAVSSLSKGSPRKDGPGKQADGIGGEGVNGGKGGGGGALLEGDGASGQCFGNPDRPGDGNGVRSGAAARKGGGDDEGTRDRGEGREQGGWPGERLEAGGERMGTRDEGREEEEEEEVYNGELLILAERLGRRLLPAFETPTGIPYGTVNLKTGVPEGETTISSLAGAGSLTMEFSVLSALTGDGVFAEAAEGAVKALFNHRTAGLGLLGKHIDSKTGVWTEPESGIGTNGDSFFEYLIKMYVLWGDLEYFDMFMQCYVSAQRFLREGDWYAGVEIESGVVTSRTFDNLMAFWPGMQTLIGDVSLASRTLNAFYLVWRDWGFLPEQLDHHRWTLHEKGVGRAYPLRPELVESTLMLHQATGDPSWLWAGTDFLGSIQAFCRTECGYAGVRDVEDCSLDEQMPSFFLSETLKYLYLLFDEDNFLHEGNYVFSTEAHPFSIEAVRRGGISAAAAANGTAPTTRAPADHGAAAPPTRITGAGERASRKTDEQQEEEGPGPTRNVDAAISVRSENARIFRRALVSRFSQQRLQQQEGEGEDPIRNRGEGVSARSESARVLDEAREHFLAQQQQQRQREQEQEQKEGEPEGQQKKERKRRKWWPFGRQKAGTAEEQPRSRPSPSPSRPSSASNPDAEDGGRPTSSKPRPHGPGGDGIDGLGDVDGGGHGDDDGHGRESGRGDVASGGGVSGSEGGGGGSWAAWRASAGEGYRLGPESWRDADILNWTKGHNPDAAATPEDASLRILVQDELQYMGALWKMYEDRTCPVLPYWQAPYPYSPVTFSDTLIVGGRAAWLSIFADRGEPASDQPPNGQSTTQLVGMKGVGVIEVTADGGNNYVLHHQGTGEILEISPVFLPGSGPGLPGGPGAGGMQITSYVRPRRQKRRQQQKQQQQQDSKSQSQLEDQHPQTEGLDPPVRDFEEEHSLEMKSGRAASIDMDISSLAHERDQTPEMPTGSRDLEEVGGLAGSDMDVGVREEALLVPQDEKTDVEDETRPEAGRLVGKEQEIEADAPAAAAAAQETAGLAAKAEREVDEGTRREEAADGAGAEGSVGDDRARARGLLSRTTVLVTREGLAVYCEVSVANSSRSSSNDAGSSHSQSDRYPCSLATFSAPGNGRAVIPPVSAPLLPVETHTPADDGRGGVSFGCVLDGTSAPPGADETAPAATSRWRRWQRNIRRRPSDATRAAADPAAAAAVAAGYLYRGSILVVSRGKCTFEHKARVAEAAGAVGLVVINDEPGGGTFAMSGVSDLEQDGAEGGAGVVKIPVAMVGMEDGAELVRTLVASKDADFREGLPIQVFGAAVGIVCDAVVLSELQRVFKENKFNNTEGIPSEAFQDLVGACSGTDDGDVDVSTPQSFRDLHRKGPPVEHDLRCRSDFNGLSDQSFPRSFSRDETGGIVAEAAAARPVSDEEALCEKGSPDADASPAADDAVGASATAGKRAEQEQETDNEEESCSGNETQHGGAAETEGADSDTDGTGSSGTTSATPSFSFLASGFDETTLGGMRTPPFLLPRVVVGEGVVQVMGLGHWGVLVFMHQGGWALSLTPNSFNPPPRTPSESSDIPAIDGAQAEEDSV